MAANSDYFMEVGHPGSATALGGTGYTVGDASITVGATTNWPTDTGVCFSIYEVTTVGGVSVMTAGSYNEYYGTVASATSITNVSHVTGSGTDKNYLAGASTIVTILISDGRENRLAQGMVIEHKQTGKHSDITADSLVIADGGTIEADIVNEATAGAGVTIDSLIIKDGLPKNWNGWMTPDETWTYASASTFTVTGDQTAKYTKGTRLKWTQTGVRYGVVVASAYTSSTLVTIAVNTDHVIDNAAITDNYYSYAANPQGYPGSFAFTPAYANLTEGAGQNVGSFAVVGRIVSFKTNWVFGAGAAVGAAAITLKLPITAKNPIYAFPIAKAMYLESGVGAHAGFMLANGDLLTSGPSPSTYIATAVPFTWGTADVITTSGQYEMA